MNAWFDPHPWMIALAWALIHFLWQGALIGLLAKVCLQLGRERSPEFRYAVACAALVAMPLALLGTWTCLVRGPEASAAGDLQMLASITGGRSADPIWTVPLLQAVILAWSAGAAFMAARLGAGLVWLYGVCLREARPLEDTLVRRFRPLVESLNAGLGRLRRPRLCVSSRVDSLLVLGWLRPVILVPASAITGLEPAHLEALLIHEWAHVRRFDDAVNLLQNLVEVLFFFHPVAWWLSRQVRLEREHCCDDVAVRRCGDPLVYASALAALEALRIPSTNTMHLAPAAKGGSLMLRIRRILTPRPQAVSGRSILPLLSAAALLAALALGQRLHATDPAPSPASVAAEESVRDVAFKQIKIKHQPNAPAYPADAKAKRIQGTVVVSIVIDTEGVPQSVKAVSGPEELRACAEGYAKDWRFEPAKVKGKAVKARFKLTMPFRLK
ncbi:MAG TPA: M56 family metallopeptidase [Holophaga sp.]|nr:M56 family metallopeptidase [Holophaga sp.]